MLYCRSTIKEQRQGGRVPKGTKVAQFGGKTKKSKKVITLNVSIVVIFLEV